MRRIVIYKKEHYKKSKDYFLPDAFTYKIWRPGISNYIPPDKSFKYILYWLFHYIRIFNNQDYSSLLVYHNEKIISSLLIVPAYFKWKFMNKNDIQFTYVITSTDYRGQGIAAAAIKIAMSELSKNNRSFWYVTDTKNYSSIKLCTKLGFEFVGYGKKYSLKSIRLITK